MNTVLSVQGASAPVEKKSFLVLLPPY
ncbi:type IV conjugative transfer system pilin TraA [Escherichia coli]